MIVLCMQASTSTLKTIAGGEGGGGGLASVCCNISGVVDELKTLAVCLQTAGAQQREDKAAAAGALGEVYSLLSAANAGKEQLESELVLTRATAASLGHDKSQVHLAMQAHTEDLGAQMSAASTRCNELGAQVAALEDDGLGLRNQLSRVTRQCQQEKDDKDAARDALETEQAARVHAEARIEEEYERVRGLERELQGSRAQCQDGRQEREQESTARQELEHALNEQEALLKRVQQEREELMTSQDALKTDADAMRDEVKTFMQQARLQELERQRQLEMELEALELVSTRLADSMTKTRIKTDQSFLKNVGERTRMMAQVAQLHDDLVLLQKAHHDQSVARQRAEDSVAQALNNVDAVQSRHDVARAEMEADALTRVNEVALIKDLRIRLETTGQQLRDAQDTLHSERSSAEQELAQARQACGSAQAEAQHAELQREQARQDLEKHTARICSLEAQVRETHQTLHDTESKGGEIAKQVKSLMGEVETRDTRLREVQVELEEAQVNLRAAEERAAVIECELPAALDRSESLDKEKSRLTRQLELVGERVFELEAALQQHTSRVQTLEEETTDLRQEAAREATRLIADREEERMLQTANTEVERCSHLSHLQRERTSIEGDREAERAIWAMERERHSQDLAAALESERSSYKQRALATQQEHEIERQDAAAAAQRLSEQVGAALHDSQAATTAAQSLQQKLSTAHQQIAEQQDQVRQHQQRAEQVQQQVESERLQMLQRLTEVEAARECVVFKLQEQAEHLDTAAHRQAATEADLLAARDTLGSKEVEMEANTKSLEDKIRRGAEERRALERLHTDVKALLCRRQAAHDRLLHEQAITRGALASAGVSAQSLASSSVLLSRSLYMIRRNTCNTQ